MSPNELMNTVQVRKTGYIDEVKANLDAGWKLLLVYTQVPSSDFPNDLQSVYSLGWPAELGEPNFIEFEHSSWAPDPEDTKNWKGYPSRHPLLVLQSTFQD